VNFENTISNLDINHLRQLSPDALFAKFGGEHNATEILKWCNFHHTYPELARDKFMPFIKYMHPGAEKEDFEDPKKTEYDEQPHHTLICEALTEVLEGRCKRLMISMPPQSGKSTIGTRMFIPYHIGRFPRKHLMIGAYNQDFAEDFGDEVRNAIESTYYRNVFPDIELRHGSKAKDRLVTTDGAKINFLGRGGSATGRPADGFLLDDMIKDAKEAASKTVLEDIWEWFNKVVYTRCHGESWMVIIMTRWSDDDVIGRITNKRNMHYRANVAKQWTVLNIPSIMTDPGIAKALGKKVGDPLWPSRFPIDHLNIAKEMDPAGFSALHQGKPTPPEGAFYKKADFHYYDSIEEFPKNVRMYETGDLAVSTDLHGNRSCIGQWGLDEEDCLWLHYDLIWERINSDDCVEDIIDNGINHNVMEAVFEKGQIEKAIGPFLRKRMMVRKAAFNLVALPASKNKGVKSMPFRGRMKQGKVKFPRFAPWWSDAEHEMLHFTGSGADANDDFCDMASLIGQHLFDTIRAGHIQTEEELEAENKKKFPKVGTLAWTKYAADQERRLERGMKNMGGL